jgi:hypothetical protein
MAITTAKKLRTTKRQPQGARKAIAGDTLTKTRLRFALAELDGSGTLTGARSLKLSTRVDPGLVEAARRRTGLRSDSDLINAALAVIAAGDDFGAWLVRQAGRLPKDFDLDL